MMQRGRKSSGALSVVPTTTVSPLEVHQRQPAPVELSEEETVEWYAVVDNMPAAWFGRETQPLLTQYCRHVVRARRVAQLLQDMENPKPNKDGEIPAFDIALYNQVLIMQDRESRAIATLSTKMRIAQQSTYDKSQRKGSSTSGSRPWEDN